jgi:hypothetical protein
MNPATPVTTQTLGAERSCSRRWGYGAKITSSQWKCTRRADSGQSCAGAHRSINHAAPCGHPPRRDKASSIPGWPNSAACISRVLTGAYECGIEFACHPGARLVAVLPHSCGNRTTIDTPVSVGALMRASFFHSKGGKLFSLEGG